MARIKIPKTPKSAYNEQRPPNALIKAQVRELQRAVKAGGGTLRRLRPKTEGEAAAHIRHLTRSLHQDALLPNAATAPSMVQPTETKARTKPKAKARTKPKSKARRRAR